jgi:hypothetical protein
VADTSGPFATLRSNASINNAGAVAFHGSLDSGGSALVAVNGVTTTPIADTSGAFAAFSHVAMNAGGTVAFYADLDSGRSGIFTDNGGQVVKIADTSGPFADVSEPAINAAGTVAFNAVLRPGVHGVFTGDDLPNDTVIRTGDPLFGSRALDLAYKFGVALNDNGDIAFNYRLENGVSGIAVAVAVAPEPGAVAPLALAGLLLPLAGRRGRRATRGAGAATISRER